LHPIRTAGKSFIGEQTVSKRIAVSLANKTEEGLIKIKWGSKIVQRDKGSRRKNDFNPIIKIPIGGV